MIINSLQLMRNNRIPRLPQRRIPLPFSHHTPLLEYTYFDRTRLS